MSALISDRQEILSVSVHTDTTSKNTTNQSGSKSKQNNNSNNSQPSNSSTETFSDSFEFSSVKNFSELTYSAQVFQKNTNFDNADPNKSVTIPKSMEALNKEANQRLNDYFGSDSSKRKEYQNSLDTLESIDPELAQKALFLITLLGQEDATEFLSEISTFTSNIRQTFATGFSINVVASAQSTSIDNIYTSMKNDTAMAVERYGEIISEKFELEINFSDPLVLDLDGDGIELTRTEDGVEFDIDGDGVKEQTAFIKGDDALLYLDQNGNGTVDNGKELFGDQEGDANGYSELARYDENNDGKIDDLDAIYTELRLWQDKNQDGKNQSTESMSLLEAGIKSIQLKYNEIMKDDNKGNKIGQTSEFTRIDGSKGYSADMLFRTQVNHNRISDLLLA